MQCKTLSWFDSFNRRICSTIFIDPSPEHYNKTFSLILWLLTKTRKKYSIFTFDPLIMIVLCCHILSNLILLATNSARTVSNLTMNAVPGEMQFRSNRCDVSSTFNNLLEEMRFFFANKKWKWVFTVFCVVYSIWQRVRHHQSQETMIWTVESDDKGFQSIAKSFQKWPLHRIIVCRHFYHTRQWWCQSLCESKSSCRHTSDRTLVASIASSKKNYHMSFRKLHFFRPLTWFAVTSLHKFGYLTLRLRNNFGMPMA